MNNSRKIVILGSTGSIGENALRIVQTLPQEHRQEVIALAAHSNYKRLLEQAAEFNVKNIALMTHEAAEAARAIAPKDVCVHEGVEGMCTLATLEGNERLICAIVGMAALPPVVAAINAGIDVAIATKEVLVAAGEFVCRLCKEKKVNLYPIDSEHSAIFQALQDSGATPWCTRNNPAFMAANPPEVKPTIERLILTASGGPFAFIPEVDFSKITVEQALKHPRWSMGPKVTIDSSTMMNKGLELIEARWLFDIPMEQIDVLVHPESIVHSLVEFKDGAQLAQLGVPDMRVPIQYAMTWPYRVDNQTLPRLRLEQQETLHFYPPNYERFPCLRLAREACEMGGLTPCVMNAANEVAVAEFLKGRIAMPRIWELISKAMAEAPIIGADDITLDAIFDADKEARSFVAGLI